MATTRPKDVIQALHDAIDDLGWFEAQPLGYLCTFTNTPGSTLVARANDRYLVEPATTTAPSGQGAVFDVLRSPVGGILAVTLVTGGEGYFVIGRTGASSSGTTVTVDDTTGINPGMVVERVAGTGALQTNTQVVAILSSTTFSINQTPTTPLSGATIRLADTMTLSAGSIGGSTYTVSATGTSGQTTITVASATNVFPGQVVTGTGIGPLCVVSSIAGTVVTLSKANTDTVSGNVTFSDAIIVTATGVSNVNGLVGTASGLQITNVAVNNNIYVGATVEITSGPTWETSNGRAIISAVSGTGPYTITLRNEENTFKGFTTTGAVTFNVSSGTDNEWFELDLHTAPQTYCWAVAKIKNAESGKLRNTFWLFYAGHNNTFYNGVTLGVRPLTGFNALSNVCQGVSTLDFTPGSGSTAATFTGAFHPALFQVASSPFIPTTLRTRQSGLDPNFATFAILEGNNNRNPFFLSKYNTAYQPWSLNDVFLGGLTEVFQNPVINVNDAGLLFRTRVGAPKRMAESGYSNYTAATTSIYFTSSTGSRQLQSAWTTSFPALYSRQLGDLQTSLTTSYPIYKNIPINIYFAPVPYYLPEDFVLIEIPWINAAIGDTITVSETEVYTIVQLATNQITYTGLAFAARTV